MALSSIRYLIYIYKTHASWRTEGTKKHNGHDVSLGKFLVLLCFFVHFVAYSP